MIKKIILLLVLSSIAFISCDTKTSKKEFYQNGKLKKEMFLESDLLKTTIEYDSLGFVTKKIHFNNEEKIDSLIQFSSNSKMLKKEIRNDRVYWTTYYNNQAKESEGYVTNDSLKNGWWLFYDSKGGIQSKREYVLTCDDYYLNQSLIFNKKGDTIFRKDNFNQSTFFKLSIDEKGYQDVITYNVQPISKSSKIEFIFLKKDNYCIEKNEVDTIIQVNKKYGKITFNKPKNSYRGFVFDYYIDTTYVNDKMKLGTVSRKMFFNLKKEGIKPKLIPEEILAYN